ncbi:MAG: 4Fe-4S dicluster domain-containing protein [Candidatus Zixiibacteriota bacterium]|nr:MAG: 4Fe-4S dicluster domain-containing protein [candidate division Zixibacteria bacterium]
MRKDRRDFLKMSAAATGALVAGAASAAETPVTADFSRAYGVLVDTVLCVGCRKCEQACYLAHSHCKKDPESLLDRTVFEESRRPDECAYTVVNRFVDPDRPDRNFWMKAQCMHCNQPACVSACIVGALTKDWRGPVVYDTWKCIGCRYCFLACPFDILAYEYNNALDPQVRKCTFCHERMAEPGFRPACVKVCPGGALTYGTREQLIDLALLRIKQSPEKYIDRIYGQHEVGGTSWMYLAGVDFAKTSLPEPGDQPISSLTETIQHGVFKSFVPPLALYGLLGLIMHSLKDNG